jgi:hypothetical protein
MKRTKAQEAERNEAINWFRAHTKPGDTIYTILESVSRSGMSRQIRVLVPFTRDGGSVDFFHPNHAAATILGCRQAKRGDGLVIGGCGMDMGFHVVYEIGSAVWPDGVPCVGVACRSNDHSNGDHDRTPHSDAHPHLHHDGGYTFNQRWL